MKKNIVFAGIGSALAVLVLVGAGCSSEEHTAALSEDLEARVEEVGADVREQIDSVVDASDSTENGEIAENEFTIPDGWTTFSEPDMPFSFYHPGEWIKERDDERSIIYIKDNLDTYETERGGGHAIQISWRPKDPNSNDQLIDCDSYELNSVNEQLIECFEKTDSVQYSYSHIRNPLLAGGDMVRINTQIDQTVYNIRFYTVYMYSIPEKERIQAIEDMISSLSIN